MNTVKYRFDIGQKVIFYSKAAGYITEAKVRSIDIYIKKKRVVITYELDAVCRIKHYVRLEESLLSSTIEEALDKLHANAHVT